MRTADREHRLRVRIDLLLDQREALTDERDHLVGRLADVIVSRDRWRARSTFYRLGRDHWKTRALAVTRRSRP